MDTSSSSRKRTRSSSKLNNNINNNNNLNDDITSSNDNDKKVVHEGNICTANWNKNGKDDDDDDDDKKKQSYNMTNIATTRTTTTTTRNGILMILSPAKTFDMRMNVPSSIASVSTIPNCCPKKTHAIATFMKQQSVSDLAKLLSLSKSLAATTKEYYSNFNLSSYNTDPNATANANANANADNDTTTNSFSKQCIYLYSGAAYQGIQIQTCSDETVHYMQQNLRILDAVYGLLRPLDIIQCYRLEMATKNITLPPLSSYDTTNNNDKDNNNTSTTTSSKIKLHDYWSNDITNALGNDLLNGSTNIVLNLASQEYSCAINVQNILLLSGSSSSCHYVDVIFKDDNRIVSVHAKRARGLMVRYISENNISTLHGIKQFTVEGYQYVPNQSTNDNDNDNMTTATTGGGIKRTTLVFNRSKQANQQQKQKQQSSKVASTKKKSSKKVDK